MRAHIGESEVTLIKKCSDVSQMLKALAHPQRLQLLCHLSQKERTVRELEALCKASQSHISQFLNRMKSERLVSSRRNGNFVYYKLSDKRVLQVLQALGKIYAKS